jgi:hemerythrin
LKTALYIVWNDKQSIHVPILDEQHHAIVAAINSLYFFINQGWGLSGLSPTLKVIKTCVGFHLKTEEGILEKLGADYKTMLKHAEIYEDFEKNAELALKNAIFEQDPMILLKFLKEWWLNHHNKAHADYQKYLRPMMVDESDL